MTQAFDVHRARGTVNRPKRYEVAGWCREWLAMVCEEFGVAPADVTGDRRFKTIVEARMVLCWLLRANTDASYPEIGFQLGRDHTSVMSAVRRVDECARLRARAERLMPVRRVRVDIGPTVAVPMGDGCVDLEERFG